MSRDTIFSSMTFSGAARQAPREKFAFLPSLEVKTDPLCCVALPIVLWHFPGLCAIFPSGTTSATRKIYIFAISRSKNRACMNCGTTIVIWHFARAAWWVPSTKFAFLSCLEVKIDPTWAQVLSLALCHYLARCCKRHEKNLTFSQAKLQHNKNAS